MDKVAEFCSVSGSDSRTAQKYLELADNNLELAIQLFLESPQPMIEHVVDLTDSTLDVFGENSKLKDLFKPPIELLHSGTFEEAKHVGCFENRWLIINIQDPKEFQCHVLNRDIWSDPVVVSVIQKSFVLMQFGVDSPQGRKYRSFYPVTQCPHVSILDPRTAELVKTWTQIGSAADFVDQMTAFLEMNSLEPPPGTYSNLRARQRTAVPGSADATRIQFKFRGKLWTLTDF